MATSVLVSTTTDEIGIDVEHRFETKAEEFVRAVASPRYSVVPRAEIAEVPGVKFSAVLRGDGHIWLVSYINGSTLTYFRRNLCDTLVNFRHARERMAQERIRATIPLVNNEASGYQLDKLGLHFQDLERETDDRVVRWTERDRLRDLLHS